MNPPKVARLNPGQQAVIDHGLLDSGFSVVLQMPTGSGKTWLARQAIARVVAQGRRAVYLTPLRASAEELTPQWQAEFADVPVGIFTGDYGKNGSKYPVSYEDARILIMTPERLDACLRSWRSHWEWIPEIDLIVVDELHLLADPNRGPRLEGTISRFRRLNPFTRYLGLSATMGNRAELADWLEGVEFHSDWRPVPLAWRVARYRKAEQKPELLVEEVSKALNAGGQSIIFVQSRRRSEVLARFLLSRGLSADFHHAGLVQSERKKAEDAFRSGATRILVATGTLEMGLNLPARQVILYDLQAFDGSGFAPLAVNTVWQRAGRAGRPGLDDTGEVVLFAAAWDREVDKYLAGRFEKITSSLQCEASLAEQILIETQSGMARSLAQIERALGSSLAAFQTHRLPIAATVQDMITAGMLREEEATTGKGKALRILATPLGRVAIRHLLRPTSVLQIRAFLESHRNFTSFDALLACALTADCEPILSVDFEDLESLADILGWQESSILANDRGFRASQWAGSGKRRLSALKTAGALMRFTSCGDVDLVALEDNCYPFEIHRLQDSMDRLLLAACAVQRLLDGPSRDPDTDETLPKSPQLRRLELLRQMVLTGLDDQAAALTLVDGIGVRWAQRLVAAGIPHLCALGAAPLASVHGLGKISEKRASEWIAAAQVLAVTPIPSAAAPRIRLCPVEADCPVDPYRLRRALDLHCVAHSPVAWTVSGGLEPHAVSLTEASMHCDCIDSSKGHTCKHILAVRLMRKDPVLIRAVKEVQSAANHEYLDLFRLWFDR